MPDEEHTEVGSKELVVANEFLHPLVPYGAVKAMREMTRRIMLFDTGKNKLSAAQASHFAQLCLSARLNPFDGEIWAWVDDHDKLSIMPGRRGLLRHAHEQARERATNFWPRYEQVTDPERRADLHIPEGALAFESKVFDHLSTTTWTQAVNAVVDAAKAGVHIDASDLGSIPCVVGLGVLTVDEMRQLDRQSTNKMTHVERCQKRAYMMALKQMFDLPLAGYVGNQGETMDDFVLDAEWREVPKGATEAPDDKPEERAVKTPEQKAGDREALYGSPDMGGLVTPETIQAVQVEIPAVLLGPIPRSWSAKFVIRVRDLFEDNLVMPPNEDRKHLLATLNLSPFDETWSSEAIVAWGKAYRSARDQDVPPKAAAVMATASIPSDAPF